MADRWDGDFWHYRAIWLASEIGLSTGNARRLLEHSGQTTSAYKVCHTALLSACDLAVAPDARLKIAFDLVKQRRR